MRAFILLATVACATANLIAAPYAGLPLAYNGLPAAYSGLPYAYAAGYAPYAAPVAAPAAATIAAPIAAPVAPVASQYSAADEFANFNYGYSNINSAKVEAGNAYGGVSGSYSYVDANGELQTTNYVADALGFRVAATNLPVAKAVELEQPVFDLVGPAPVEDTEEVKAAKAEFQKAFDEATMAAAERKRREVPADTTPLTIAAPAPIAVAPYAAAPLAYAGAPLAYAGAPLAYAGAPLAYATAPAVAAPTVSVPATREATLTKIQLTPGHAVAYIVN